MKNLREATHYGFLGYMKATYLWLIDTFIMLIFYIVE